MCPPAPLPLRPAFLPGTCLRACSLPAVQTPAPALGRVVRVHASPFRLPSQAKRVVVVVPRTLVAS